MAYEQKAKKNRKYYYADYKGGYSDVPGSPGNASD